MCSIISRSFTNYKFLTQKHKTVDLNLNLHRNHIACKINIKCFHSPNFIAFAINSHMMPFVLVKFVLLCYQESDNMAFIWPDSPFPSWIAVIVHAAQQHAVASLLRFCLKVLKHFSCWAPFQIEFFALNLISLGSQNRWEITWICSAEDKRNLRKRISSPQNQNIPSHRCEKGQ